MNISEALAVVGRHTDRAPVDVRAISVALSVPLEFKFLDDNISGAIKADIDAPNGYSILVNAAHAPVRQRFTIAHELGHFIYHRDLLGRGTGDTRAYRAEPRTGFPNPHITPLEERQANAFAANVLMPRALISEFENRGIVSSSLLAEIFEVSVDAMRIRLGLPRVASQKELALF